MGAWLLNLWDRTRSSFWFVPGLFALAAVVGSMLLPQLDLLVRDWNWDLPGWLETTQQTARSTLTALAGAMIAVTGTVFSITIVTLSLASQQLGPRLLRRFMEDVPTKITMGVFLSTGFYCLFALRAVEKHDSGASVPHLAVAAALVLGVVSMGMLIHFIHHITTIIQAPQVVAAVARDLDSAIDELFPESAGKGGGNDGDPDDAEIEMPEGHRTIRAKSEGYIQAIDLVDVVDIARKRHATLRLHARPGDFLQRDTTFASVWLEPGHSAWPDLDDLHECVNDVVIVDVRRTPRQDVECAIEELAEVAVRSLSPGINDPFTAINCVDRLGAALSRFADRAIPSPRRHDDEGVLRVIARPYSFAGALGAAFNQIRQYGRNSVAVTARILEALGSIAEKVFRPADAEAVRLHADMLLRSAEGAFDEEMDLECIRERHGKVLDILQKRKDGTGSRT